MSTIADQDQVLDKIREAMAFGKDPMIRAVDVLKAHVSYYDWVGIYLIKGDNLILHYYIGKPTEHTCIPLGSGICSAAVEKECTVMVNDVRADPRHIACSLDTRSEVVVPFRNDDGVIVGEIDIDSDTPSAFDSGDREFLEKVAELLGNDL